MPRVIATLLLIGASLYSFFDVLGTDKSLFRRVAKSAWLVIVLVPAVGPVLWFSVGRSQRAAARGGREGVITLPSSRRRPMAPDDDPAFLRKLDEDTWRARRRAREAQGPDPASGPVGSAAPETPGSDPGVGVQPAEEEVDPEVVEDKGQQPE